MSNLWNREPALIVGFVQAALVLALTFGVDLSAEQIAGILSLTAAGLGLVVRRRVSPVYHEPSEPDPALESQEGETL